MSLTYCAGITIATAFSRCILNTVNCRGLTRAQTDQWPDFWHDMQWVMDHKLVYANPQPTLRITEFWNSMQFPNDAQLSLAVRFLVLLPLPVVIILLLINSPLITVSSRVRLYLNSLWKFPITPKAMPRYLSFCSNKICSFTNKVLHTAM